MKILFLTPRFLYPVNRGDKVRPFYLARVLSKQHEIHLLSFIQSREEREHIPYLKRYFKEVHTIYLPKIRSYLNMGIHSLNNLPLQVSYFRSKKFVRLLRRLLSECRYDVVYAFHIRMAPYLQACNNHYRIFDITDAVSLFMDRLYKHTPWYKKPIYAFESDRIRKYEKDITGQFEECWIISEEDKVAIEDGITYKNLYIVPNGVDTDFFSPKEHTSGKNIIFVGYMGVESVDAVLYFCNEIWPKVKSDTTGVKFYIIGANPPAGIKELHNGKDIFVTGFVPDLREYYQKAAVAIAPVRFVAGMQNKILEAMAMEVPVVTTSYGNEGIGAQNGEEIFLENGPSEFADKVSFLLSNPSVGREIGRNAREFVRSKYNWGNVYRRINVVNEIVSKKSHA